MRLLLPFLFLFSGCNTVSKGFRKIADTLSSENPVRDNTIYSASNPWPFLGAIVFLCGALYIVITGDRSTGFGAVLTGLSMGIVGVAFNHPWAPFICLVFLLGGAGYKLVTLKTRTRAPARPYENRK